MRRRLHRCDQRFSREMPLEAAKLLGGDDDHFIATVHGHVLRPLAANLANQFAEARLGVLEHPVSGTRFGRARLRGS